MDVNRSWGGCRQAGHRAGEGGLVIEWVKAGQVWSGWMQVGHGVSER